MDDSNTLNSTLMLALHIWYKICLILSKRDLGQNMKTLWTKEDFLIKIIFSFFKNVFFQFISHPLESITCHENY